MIDDPTADARAEIAALAAENGLDPALPEACEAEVAAWVEDPGLDDPSLVDLTHLAFATIDNPDSKDLDQALCVEVEDDGHVVWYALADASYYVRPGSALFAEALRRGATFYLPGLVVPMLPKALCEGLVSLNPEVPRRAMVMRMRVGPHGACRGTEVLRGRIRSRAKLSYEGVQAWYDGGPPPCEDAAVHASLEQLRVVGERRLHEAEARNVVRHRRCELRVSLADAAGGAGYVATGETRNDCERFNEQVSLLANTEGARRLRDGAGSDEVHPIFRTHLAPDPAKLRSFERQVETIRAAHGLPEEGWQWRQDGAESLAAYVRRLTAVTGPDAGVAAAIRRQTLLLGGRSGFEPTPSGHYGVGADVYARFTAPMREVVGIFVHKEMWEMLGCIEPQDPAEDERTREQVVAASQAARQLQRVLDRKVNRRVLDQLFQRDLEAAEPRARAGTVMGLGRGKVHVHLADPPIDVKVYALDLTAARGEPVRVHADDAVVRIGDQDEPWLRVGDAVTVRVLGVDAERDRWRLGLER